MSIYERAQAMDTITQNRSGSPIGSWLNERLGLQGMSYAVLEYAISFPFVELTNP
jgi:hypothetical protein